MSSSQTPIILSLAQAMAKGQDSFSMLYNSRRTISSSTIAAQIMDGESSVNMLSTSIPRLGSIPEGRLPVRSAGTQAMDLRRNGRHRDRDIAAQIMEGESSVNLLSTSIPHLRPVDKSPPGDRSDALEYINVSPFSGVPV
jgi:hypothetical protein